MPSTAISFRILAPLYSLHTASLTVPTSGEPIELSITITESGLSAAKTTGGVTVPGDDLGALHNSIVTVTLPGAHSLGPVATSPYQPGQVPQPIRHAVDALNLVIDHYRDAKEAPQIRRIPYNHARGAVAVTNQDDGSTTTQMFFGGNALAPTGEPAPVALASDDFVAEMQARVGAGALPLWKSIAADSKAELASGNVRSGLAHLYMAFEMLALATCLRLGRQVVGEDDARDFLEPLDADPPYVFKVVRRCRAWASNGPSTAKLNGLMNRLMRHRNGVMHGRARQISQAEVDEALEAFEALTEWMRIASPKD